MLLSSCDPRVYQSLLLDNDTFEPIPQVVVDVVKNSLILPHLF